MIRKLILVAVLAFTATIITALALGFAVAGEWPFADLGVLAVAMDFLRDSGEMLFLFHLLLGFLWIEVTT
jgi:hypothetical protein